MMKLHIGLGAGVIALLLSSCGGGGSAVDSLPSAPSAQANSIQRYAGNYNGACELVDGASNLDQGGAVYARTVQSVSPLTDEVGAFSYRIDFYADAQCSAMALGSMSNANPGSRVTIVGAVRLGDGDADKVRLSILPTSEPFAPGSSSNTVVFGSAVRLSLPSFLFGAFELRDLWRLNGSSLYEGGQAVGMDGFPLGLDPFSPSVQVPSLPAVPAQPCASTIVNWTENSAACLAQVPLALSTGQETWIDDSVGPATGRASFTCVNGEWSAPRYVYCVDPTRPPPPCPEQTWTWTVNGNTCTGAVPAGANNSSAINDTPGLMGMKQLTCVAAPSGGYQWSEFIFAPTYPTATAETCDVVVVLPPVTDPLQILKNKNCMLCHSVTSAEPGFLSFETIAAFYRDSPPAPGVLEAKIKEGGIGVFLDFPMPANSQISDDELAIVVPWILSR